MSYFSAVAPLRINGKVYRLKMRGAAETKRSQVVWPNTTSDKSGSIFTNDEQRSTWKLERPGVFKRLAMASGSSLVATVMSYKSPNAFSNKKSICVSFESGHAAGKPSCKPSNCANGEASCRERV